MVKMGRVALDGTKLRANASKHKAMSYDRLVDKEAAVEAEIAEPEPERGHRELIDTPGVRSLRQSYRQVLPPPSLSVPAPYCCSRESIRVW